MFDVEFAVIMQIKATQWFTTAIINLSCVEEYLYDEWFFLWLCESKTRLLYSFGKSINMSLGS